MTISNETLLAYVDGELDVDARAEVDAAIAADPALAARVDAARALRRTLAAAYDPVLDEPLPPRLLAAAAADRERKVADLDATRKTRRLRAAPAAWGWQQWGGMAAALMIGVVAGRMPWLAPEPDDDIVAAAERLVARGRLAQALSTQLASTQAADEPVKIGLSYLSRSGAYCRTFALRGAGGLACRQGDDWALRVLTQDAAPAAGSGDLRMAASPVPPALLQLVEQDIQGAPLDADAERSAMRHGWSR